MAKRFIVVDPSFTSHDGDRWQYAVDLANASRERGYQFVLLTNKRAPSIRRAAGFSVIERKVFDHTFFDHDKVYERHRKVGSSASRNRANLARKDRIDALELAQRMAQERGDHLTARRLSKRLERVRHSTAFGQRLRQWATGSEAAFERPFNRDNFAQALARELETLKPGPEDILFFHTMTYGMMESLSEVTAALEHRPPFDTQAYFLFHFGAEAPDAKTFLDRYYSYSAYGSIAERMRVGSPFQRLHFLATCKPLQDEAERILGAPVTLWPGLVNPKYVDKTLGGWERILERRAHAQAQIEQREVRVLVRAADLDRVKARSVSRACHLAQHRGNVVRLRLIYHSGSFAKLRDIVSEIDFPNLELIETEANESYLREVCDAGIVLLTYDAAKYEKRVSAVLHDCAVLGVPSLVPAGSTLADCDYAPKFVYGSDAELVGALLNAVRYLQRRGQDLGSIDHARAVLAGNAVDRLLECSPRASLVRSAVPAPLANVIMPLWGRVGSSFAMEAQIRYLIGAGYFVNQVFLMDKPVDPREAIEYFWRVLRQNSVYARGSIQRIAWRDFARNKQRLVGSYFKRGAFGQLLHRYALNRVQDPQFERQLRNAKVTVVNHVFHSKWAFRYCGGRMILETHDIQSYQMANWPLINEGSGAPEPLSDLLREEMAEVAKYHHVVNVAPEEHRILSTANRRASLVTPYLPEPVRQKRYRGVWDMAYELGLHESYRDLDAFDTLIVADAHPANVESVLWFIREVFIPHLLPQRVNLTLAGNISNAIHAEIGGVANLFYLGFVDDLEAVKDLSYVCILPDRRGTGISIKTLEAMASGMPFVATSVALRGIRDRLPADLQHYDDPADMANAIVMAVRSPERRAKLAAQSHDCYAKIASSAQFEQAWDSIMHQAYTAPANRLEARWRKVRAGVRRWQSVPRYRK